MHENVSDEDVPNSSIMGGSAGNDSGGTLKIDDFEVRMDLTDDLLHMVCTIVVQQLCAFCFSF